MPSPTIYSYTFIDDKGVKATLPVFVAYDAATETVGALVGNVAALGGTLDALSGAQIIDARIIIDVAPDPSWKSSPVAGDYVETGGKFTFGQNGSKYVDSLVVPGIANANVVNGKIDLTSGHAADNFIQQIIGAGGIGGSHTVYANSKFLNALNSFRFCDLNVRKHRRQLTKQTSEV